MTLVHVPDCPNCGKPADHDEWTEEPLLRGGGYGHARRTTVRRCKPCGWRLTVAVSSLRPTLPR